MTEPSAAQQSPIAPVLNSTQRLHPMSWLFVLLTQLRQFLVPLIALFLIGRRSDEADRSGPWWAREWDSELWPLIGVAVLALAAVWRYFTYRYGIGDDALVIRSGVLARSLRVIPFARIHNVALEQSLLHRLFGVASVRLESAGAKRPEAEMRVLSLEAAVALEALVRRHGAKPPAVGTPAEGAGDAVPAPGAPPAADATRSAGSTVLVRLPLREVLLQGVLSNRGLIAAGAIFAALSQPGVNLDWNVAWRFAERWGRAAIGTAPETMRPQGPVTVFLLGVAILLGALILVRLLSVALTLLQEYGFTLTREGRRLTVERGLLSRVRTSISRRRIQAWTLSEPLLHRLVGRRSLTIDNAAGAGADEDQHTLRTLAPILRPDEADRLIHTIAPDTGWPKLAWRPLDPRHWWRRLIPALPLVVMAALLVTWLLSPAGLLLLLWVPLAIVGARREADLARWAVTDTLIAVREGWIKRTWRFAELDKLQAIELSRSPLDRRQGTATLWLDTAGARPMATPLKLAYLPEEDAVRIAAVLSDHLARHALRW